MLTCTSVVKSKSRSRTIVRERLNNKNKEISQGYVLTVEYLRNDKRYSSYVFTLILDKSHATKRYKLRLRSFQRFRDIIVVNIKK